MKGNENRYLLQDVFSSYAEYKRYIKKNYQFVRGQKNKGSGSLVPTYLEIKLSTRINNQRMYIDKKRNDTLIIELPVRSNVNTKKRGAIKTRAMITYGPVLGTFEKALVDDFAITEKLFDMK